MRVILDTNVLLAALIAPYAAPDTIYRAWRAARFELATSTVQLDELRRASRHPKPKTILPAHRVGAMVNNMNMHRAIVLETLPTLPETSEIRDLADEFLLAMTLAGNADYVVMGDRCAGLLQQVTSVVRASSRRPPFAPRRFEAPYERGHLGLDRGP